MNSTITRGMETFTVEDFQKHFDELLERVDNGESFVITSEYGNAVIVPYEEYQDLTDDEFNCFYDHNDGC
jgi:prevent-host-death family protein